MTNFPSVKKVDNWLNEEPEVTLPLWNMKIMSTPMGETGPDFLAVNTGLGRGLTRTAMAALLKNLRHARRQTLNSEAAQ
jgi:uncharacterized membrane-anchored protein